MAINPDTNKLLGQITKGMNVVDARGADVGKVTFVQFSDPGAATNDPAPDPVEGTFLEDSANAFTGDSAPDEEAQERLFRQGFIKIDEGIMGDDKYVASRQVAEVRGDVVHLSISKDTL